MNPQTLGHKLIASGDKKGAPLYSECLGFIGQSQMDFPWSVWCWPLSDTENESTLWESEANLTFFFEIYLCWLFLKSYLAQFLLMCLIC